MTDVWVLSFNYMYTCSLFTFTDLDMQIWPDPTRLGEIHLNGYWRVSRSDLPHIGYYLSTCECCVMLLTYSNQFIRSNIWDARCQLKLPQNTSTNMVERGQFHIYTVPTVAALHQVMPGQMTWWKSKWPGRWPGRETFGQNNDNNKRLSI